MRILTLILCVLWSGTSFCLSVPPALKDYITNDAYIVSGTLLSAKLIETDEFVNGGDYKLRVNASVGLQYSKDTIKFHMRFFDGGMGARKPAVGDEYIFFIHKENGKFEAKFLMIINVANLNYKFKAAYGFHELLPSVNYFSQETGMYELVLADEDNPNKGGVYGQILYEYNSYLEYLEREYEKLNK